MTWVRYEPKARMHVLDRIFPEGIHIPDYFFGKNIVHLPTMKCHIYTTTTGAMKNAFGGLLNTQRHYTHSWIHETLVDLLAIQKEIHTGLFAIMDGTTAGNGPGPRTMYPGREERHAGVGRPGGDRRGGGEDDGLRSDVARVHPPGARGRARRRRPARHRDRRRRRRRAGELGVPRRQQLVRVGGGDLIWFGPLKRFQKLFFHTPLVNVFILASEVYHDYYRWPLVDRRVFERWCETTAWGQMFLRYAQSGPQGLPIDAVRPAARHDRSHLDPNPLDSAAFRF